MKIIVKIEDKWIKLDLYKDRINDIPCRNANNSPDEFLTTHAFFKITHDNKDYWVNPACIQFLVNEE